MSILLESAPGRLSPNVLDAVTDLTKDIAEPHLDVFAPGYYFRAIVRATYVQRVNRLRGNPPERLASSLMRPRIAESTLQATLRTIVNQSITPHEVTAPSFVSRGCAAYEGICHKADFHFATLVGDADCGTLSRSFGARVIRDNDQRPILIQKGQGSTTALSLAPLAIEGTEYPAGSIMGIHLEQDYGPLTGKYNPSIEPGVITEVSADEIDGIDYLRPSLLGLQLAERPALLRSCTVSRMQHATAYEVFTDYTLHDVVDVLAEAR